MQNDSGLRALLSFPSVYNLFQTVVGAQKWRKQFIHETVRAKAGDKFVDVGCGPAKMIDWLPPVRYVGWDVSEDYINHARKQYGSRGVFLVGNTKTLRGNAELQHADIVMCCGVLHHLNDDEAIDLINLAFEVLKPGGRFVAMDPAYYPGQSKLSKWVVSKDRGMNIRDEASYRALAATSFANIKITLNPSPLRIPYAGFALECTK